MTGKSMNSLLALLASLAGVALLVRVLIPALFGGGQVRRRPVNVSHNQTLYVVGAAAIIFSPVLTFVAALKLHLSPPDAYGKIFLGLFVLLSLPALIGLARIEGADRCEAFLQKMEDDAHIGRRAIFTLWVMASLVVIALGVASS